MKRFLPLSVLFVGAFIFLNVTGFNAGTPNSGDKIAKLQHQVDSLSQKVADLESQIQKLKKEQDFKKLPFIIPKGDFKSLPKGDIPKDWQKREYKGKYYYVVPLETNKKNEFIGKKK